MDMTAPADRKPTDEKEWAADLAEIEDRVADLDQRQQQANQGFNQERSYLGARFTFLSGCGAMMEWARPERGEVSELTPLPSPNRAARRTTKKVGNKKAAAPRVRRDLPS